MFNVAVFRERIRSDESGFTSAQFVVLMALTIALLVTATNFVLVEYVRQSAIHSLHDAARRGTQSVDFERARAAGEFPRLQNAEKICRDRFRDSASELFNVEVTDGQIVCTIDGNAMTASVSLENEVSFAPWLTDVFKVRLRNLNATYEQKKAD